MWNRRHYANCRSRPDLGDAANQLDVLPVLHLRCLVANRMRLSIRSDGNAHAVLSYPPPDGCGYRDLIADIDALGHDPMTPGRRKASSSDA